MATFSLSGHPQPPTLGGASFCATGLMSTADAVETENRRRPSSAFGGWTSTASSSISSSTSGVDSSSLLNDSSISTTTLDDSPSMSTAVSSSPTLAALLSATLASPTSLTASSNDSSDSGGNVTVVANENGNVVDGSNVSDSYSRRAFTWPYGRAFSLNMPNGGDMTHGHDETAIDVIFSTSSSTTSSCIPSRHESLDVESTIGRVVDDVKSLLLNEVRIEVKMLKARIVRLEKKVAVLQNENRMLRQYAPLDILSQLMSLQQQDDSSSSGLPSPSTTPNSVMHHHTLQQQAF